VWGIEMTLGRFVIGATLLLGASQASADFDSERAYRRCMAFPWGSESYCSETLGITQRPADDDDSDGLVAIPQYSEPAAAPGPVLKEWTPLKPVKPNYGVPCYKAGCTKAAK
jgi:hypothetical protein